MSAWDEWKREREASEGTVAFECFNVYRYRFTEGPRSGKTAFDLCGPYQDGSWTVEPSFADDIPLRDTDEVIDFMLKLGIQSPPKSHANDGSIA